MLLGQTNRKNRTFHLKFNNDLLDSSTSPVTPSITNAITYANDYSGNSNSAISFDGSTSRVVYATASDKMKTTFSFSYWIKPTSTGVFYRPFNSDQANANPTGAWIRTSISSDQIYFGVGSNNTNISISGGTIDTNWQLISANCIGNGSTSTIELFVNGISIGTSSGSHTSINIAKYMSIGVLYYHTVGPTYLNYYNGLMDELEVNSIIQSQSIYKLKYRYKNRIKA